MFSTSDVAEGERGALGLGAGREGKAADDLGLQTWYDKPPSGWAPR